MIETEVVTLPAYWSSALINGDDEQTTVTLISGEVYPESETR